MQLYAPDSGLSNENVTEIVRRTEGVSAAFIKELMRRTIQFYIESGSNGDITHANIDDALNEMLHKGGPLNLKLLGATQHGTAVN